MLKTFSKSEMREFDRFVRSPFHNNRNAVIKLFNEIKSFHPFTGQKIGITKVEIYRRLYPGKEYRDSVMRILGSNLKSLIESYLSYKKFSENLPEEKFMLISALRDRKLDRNTGREIKTTMHLIENGAKIDSNHFLNKYRLSLIIDEYNLLKGSENMLTSNSKELTDSLICFFLSNLFGELSARKIREEDHNAKYDPGMLIPFMNSFNAGSFFREIDNYPGLGKIFLFTYYYSYLADQNYEDEAAQQKLKDILFEHSDKFTNEMAYNLYIMLMNINIYGANENNYDTGYYKRAFEFFKDMAAKGLLTHYESDFMQEEIFLNILLTTNALKEFDWAESFVEKYINKLHPEIRDNWYNYSKALIMFNRKQFPLSLEFLMKVNFDKAMLNVIAKRLLAMIYYEMDYVEQLLSVIDSYNHYLNNDKRIPKNIKSPTLLFLRRLQSLAKIKYNRDNAGLEKLKKDMEHNPERKNWLLEKIEELERIL